MRSFHELPRFSDRWSFLYFEKCKIDKDASGLFSHDIKGKVPLPINQLSLLMLGPGVSITHAAVKLLAENNCLIAWVGQDAIRMYGHSTGGTYSSKRMIEQARLASFPELRISVAKRMYQLRFDEDIPENVTIEQLRGMEGIRVREAYGDLALRYNVEWKGRNYDQQDWYKSDPLNRALSAANACLYGICQAAIISVGLSPALGFVHTGKMLSFVYDVADFYKTDLSIPIAFKTVSENPEHLEREVREACRFDFHLSRLMERIIPDIMEVFNVGDNLRESPEEFEGKIITLADRTKDWGISGKSLEEGEG
ncbi:MAG: type I-E CRISPR-associated endonuclease Cas1 [candidate division Zixibacteria bacterium]|nr:type I-E CRISPR-associated endonuclease Cas1 [candidate division Zixibacteria bacterium]